MTKFDTSSSLSMKLCLMIIALSAFVSLVTILMTIAYDIALLVGFDTDVIWYQFFKTNLISVIGALLLLEIYEEAQKL